MDITSGFSHRDEGTHRIAGAELQEQPGVNVANVRVRNSLANTQEQNCQTEWSESILEAIIQALTRNHSNFDYWGKFKTLACQLTQEERKTEELSRKLDDVYWYYQSGDTQESKRLVWEIMKILRPIDVQKVKRYTQVIGRTTNTACKRDIVLLIGESRVANSVLAHYLYGTQLVQARNMASTIHVGGEVSEEIAHLAVSYPVQQLSFVPLHLEDAGIDPQGLDLELCVFPWPFDTQDIELELANSLELRSAIQGGKSLRVVVLLSESSSENRCSELRSSVFLLKRLFPGISDNLDAIEFLLSSSGNQRTLHDIVCQILNNPEPGESDEAFFIAVLGKLYTELQEKTLIIDPTNRKERLSVLRRIMSLTPFGTMTDCTEFFMLDKWHRTIDRFLESRTKIVQQERKHTRVDISLQVLESLVELVQILHQPSIEKAYQEVLSSVRQTCTTIAEEALQKFRQIYSSSELLAHAELDNYSRTVINLSHAKRITSFDPDVQIKCIDSLQEELSRVVNRLQQDIDELDLSDISIRFRNLTLFAKRFPMFLEGYERTTDKLVSRIQAVREQVQRLIDTAEYSQLGVTLELFETLSNLEGYLPLSITNMKTELCNRFSQSIGSTVQQMAGILATELFEQPTEYDELANVLKHVTNNSSLPTEYQVIAREAQSRAEQDAYRTERSLRFKLYDELRQHPCPLFNDLTGTVFKLEAYLKSTELQPTFESLKLTLLQEVERICKEAEDNLHSRSRPDYSNVRKAAEVLHQAQWVDRFQSGLSYVHTNKLTETLKDHVKQLTLQLKQKRISIRLPDSIQQLQWTLKNLKEIELMNGWFEGISEVCEEAHSHLAPKLASHFDVIKSNFNPDQETDCFNIELAENSRKYLRSCMNIPNLIKDYEQTYSRFLQFMRNVEVVLISKLKLRWLRDALARSELIDYNRSDEFATRVLFVFKLSQDAPKTCELVISQMKLQKLKERVLKLLKEISQHLNEATAHDRYERLRDLIRLVQALSPVDQVMNDSSKFSTLYADFDNRLQRMERSSYGLIKAAIMEQKYDRIQEEIEKGILTPLTHLTIMNKLGDSLILRAKQLEENASKFIMPGGLTELSDQLYQFETNLRGLKQSVPHFAFQKTNLICERAKYTLTYKLKAYIEETEELLAIDEYLEAADRIHCLDRLREANLRSCDQDFPDLRTRFEGALSSLSQRFQELPIELFSLDPPEKMIETLDRLVEKFGEYSRFTPNLRRILCMRFRELLSRESLSTSEIHQQFRLGLPYLPPNLAAQLESEKTEFFTR